MDPQTSVDLFNSPSTCRAVRVDIAIGLCDWLEMRGFVPCVSLDENYISDLSRHGEHQAAGAAHYCNDYIKPVATQFQRDMLAEEYVEYFEYPNEYPTQPAWFSVLFLDMEGETKWEGLQQLDYASQRQIAAYTAARELGLLEE